MIERGARGSNALELTYAIAPAIAATITSTAMPSDAMMRRLLKNLNVAPSAYGFQPPFHFMIQALLNHVLPDSFRHVRIGQRWNRLHSARACFRQEHFVVVFPDFIIARSNQLPESYIEKFLHSDPLANSIS